MKLEQYALNGPLDPEEPFSDAESVADGDDLMVNEVVDCPFMGPGGINFAGQTMILAQKPGGNEICMFIEGDPALEAFLSQPPEPNPDDSINDEENDVCDINEEDSKPEDNVSPDENDPKNY